MATRVIAYDSREFPDPDPTLPIEEIKKSFLVFFPELATSEVREIKKDEEITIFEFVRKTGTKGVYNALTPIMVVAALTQVKEFHIDLIDLSWQFVKEDGTLDEEKMAFERKAIDEAADQATAYVNGVRGVVERIFKFRELAYVEHR